MTLHVAISGWLLGTGMSGANRRLLGLLHAVPPLLGPDERLTVLHGPDFAPPDLPGVQWSPVAIPPVPTWRRVLAERRLLAAHLRRLDVDVLDHGFLPAPRIPCPLVLTIHDVRDADGHGRRPRWLGRLLLRRASARAAAVVVPSAFTQQRLRALVAAPPPTHVIGNAVAPQPVVAAPPAPPPRPFVLHVGHLEPRKNVALLLHALARLPATDRPQLQLIGQDAGDRARLQELTRRLDLTTDVVFRDRVGDAELLAAYATASAVCMPSRYEGFGLPAVEALAQGTTVLVGATGALPEVVGAHGVVLPIAAPDAWATAILAAVQDPPTAAERAARREHTRRWLPAPLAAAQLALWRALRRPR